MTGRSVYKSAAVRDGKWKALFTPAFLVGVMELVLLLVGLTITLLVEGEFGRMGLYAVGALIVVMALSIILIFHQYVIAVTLIFMIHLYADWYLGLYFVSLLMALALLLIFFLTRSTHRPWVEPPALWLWGLFLTLTILPAMRGASDLFDRALYYPNIIFGAFIFFWLGMVMARNSTSIRQVFKWLAAFGAMIALHTIIQETTGKVLFGTQQADAFLTMKSFYELSGSNVQRVGSSFLDPNWNGTFLAMMLFIPLCLFVESSLFLEKVLYLTETCIILSALLFTFSVGALVGAAAGLCAFILFLGRVRYRIVMLILIIVAATAFVNWLPTQVNLLFQHGTQTEELSLRQGAWETAIRVILAYPLLGVGLGLNNYGISAEPYRVPAQFVPLGHPHNSYLELAAMAGLPVLLLFIALLVYNMWLFQRNWVSADARTRALLAGGIATVIALSANSISINGWTLPPLAAIGWFVLGMISSPLLVNRQKDARSQENNIVIVDYST